jgi:outer membrane receptor for ferrienterochelin and colicins
MSKLQRFNDPTLVPRVARPRRRPGFDGLLRDTACAALAGVTLGAAAGDLPPQTVVITASRHAQLALDAPASMSVVTREQIEARGAEDVLDALRAETGIALQGRAVGGRKVISLRGMDPKHTLYLVDGKRIGASDGTIGSSDFQYDWVSMDDVERIEVVRGPLSVLYGSEAMGGVVNVITRQPTDVWRFGARSEALRTATARGGDGWRAAVSASGPLGDGLGLRVGASSLVRDPVASPSDPRLSELEGTDKVEGWLGLAWQPSADHRIELEHRQGEETRFAEARERGGQRRYHGTENDIERALSAIGWSAEWGADSSSQLRAYRSMIDVVNERSHGVAVNIPQRLTDDVLEGQWRQRLGPTALTLGLEWRDENLRDAGLPGGESTARHRALFVQHEWPVTAAVDLTMGVRQDRHSLFGTETSPRAYVVWRAAPGWTIKGGYSHGFKAPNLKQIVPGSRREGPNEFLGNPDLRPETSDGLELGLAWTRDRHEAQLTLFEQRVDDLIEVTLVAAGPVPGIGTYTYRNLSRATLRGLEASYALPLAGGFSAQASWNWLDARADDGRPLPRRPRQSAALRLDWTQGPWRAGLRAEHSGEQWLPATTSGAADVRGPAMTLFGAQVARDLSPWLPGLTATLGVENLGDVRPVDVAAQYTQAEIPRTWRVALSGRW